MRLRELAPHDDDVAGGLRLSRLAGWNQRGEDWRALLRMNPGRFVAAERDGLVIGTGGAAVYGRALAWICMVLVDPEHRGAGLGTQLVEAALERCPDVACVGLDATPQGQPVYERLGFVAAELILRMSLPEAARTRVQTPSSLAEVMPVGDLPAALLAQDLLVFGADRGDALRWLSTYGHAFVAGAIDDPAPRSRPAGNQGYTFGRPGEHSWHVGPVVAGDVTTAEALVRAAIAKSAPGPVIVDARAGDSVWTASLQRLGFVEKRRLTRMYRGPGRPPGRPAEERAIFGPEFG